jgi:hypothetical protein
MKKLLAVVSFSAGAVLLFFAAATFAFYHLIEVGEFRRFLIDQFESRSGLRLEIGEAKVEIGWVLGVSFRDFTLHDPQRQIAVVTAPKVLIRVGLLPLMQRKIVFTGVALYEPKTEIVRDEQGRIPWLDAVLNLPIHQKDSGFALDLRELRIEQGEVHITDRAAQREPIDTRLTSMTLAVRRLRSAAFLRPSAAVDDSAASSVGLDFDVKTIVRRGDRQADIAAKGRMHFPGDDFDIRKAHMDAYLTSAKSPAALLWEYAVYPPTDAPPKGNLAYHVHWQGAWERGFHVTCEVLLRDFEAEAPDLFATPFTLDDGRIDATVDWSAQELRVQRLELRSKALSFTASGSVAGLDGGDPSVALRVSTPFLQVAEARRYVPTKLFQSPRFDDFASGLDRGEIKLNEAEFSGRLSDLRRVSDSEQPSPFSFDLEFRGVGGNYGVERPLPLSGAVGRVVLDKGVLQYKGLRAMLGRSRITELTGTQRRPFSDAGPLEFRLKGQADLAQLKEHAAALLPTRVSKALGSIQDLGGRARLDLSMRGDSVANASLNGVATVDGARLRLGPIGLSGVRGEVRFSPDEIRADRATAKVNGGDVHLRVSLKNFSSGDGSFDVSADSPGISAGDALRLLLPFDGSKTPGIVRGAIRYRGSLASAEDRYLTGQLELVDVEVPLPVFAEPFRQVNGRLRLDGQTIDLEGMRAVVGGHTFTLDGRWRGGENPMFAFSLSSPDMDVQYILPRHVIPDEEWYERLQVRGKLALDAAKYDRFAFTDLTTDLILEKRTWRLERFAARAQGGTVQGSAAFTDRGEDGLFHIEPTVKGVPLQTVLSWFDVRTSEVTGDVQLVGMLDFSGKTVEERRRNLNGALRARVENGMMRRFQVAVRVLSFLDLSRWFTLKLPNINQEGIRFRSISADLKIARGVYSTQNFFLNGDDLRITGAGELDGAKGDIDFVIAVRPFPGLDTAWNYIPVLGTGLAAIKNSLLVASFNVRGPLTDPSVTPAPLSTLSEFFYGALAIPKGLIGFPTTAAPKESTASQ